MSRIRFSREAGGGAEEIRPPDYTPKRRKSSVQGHLPGKPRHSDLHARTKRSFGSASALWKKIPSSVKTTWTKLITDSGISTYNVYLAENATRIREGEAAILTPGSGLTIPKGLSAGSTNRGSISIWSDEPQSVCMSVLSQKIRDGMGSIEVSAIQDLTYEQLALIDGFDPGEEYFLYCIITDKPVETMTKCSASASFRVSIR